MKKLLLGTSALIGATAIVASASAAPELTISGNLDFRLVGGEAQARGLTINSTDATKTTDPGDVGGEDRSWDFARANSVSEIKFRAFGEADSGATYGANIDYRYLASSTDESYIFIADTWGRVHLGDDDGIVDGYVPRADSIATGAYLFNDTTTYITPRAVDTSDSTKIVYHSAVANGFKFGASMAETNSLSSNVTLADPASTPDANTLSTTGGQTIGLSEIVEVGIGYASEAYGVSYNLGLAVQTASVDEATKTALSSRQAGATAADTFATETDRSLTAEDLSELHFGFGLTWGNITVGGSYADAGDSGVATVGGADINISTFTGPDAATELATANAARTEVSGALTGQLSEGHEFYGVGASYDLGGGMKIAVNYGEATWGTYTGTSAAATPLVPASGTVAEVPGTQVKFNTVSHTQTLTTFDFGFPIMDGMNGYAGVAMSEYEQTAGTTDGSAASGGALTSESTTYLVGTTVSF